MPFLEAECDKEWVCEFLRAWETEIRLNDFGNFQVLGSHEANVYLYIERRLRSVLRKRRKGPAGWWFYQTDGAAGCWTWAIIWTDARSSEHQETPVDVTFVGERWWPAIVADIPGLDILPVYCPGLAWQDARPWFVHRSRVQLLPRAAL